MQFFYRPLESQPSDVCLVTDPSWRLVFNPGAGLRNHVDARAFSSSSNGRGTGKAGFNATNTGTSSWSVSSAESVAADADFTVVCLLESVNTASLNAGLFRSATGGDTFCVIKTGTGGYWPWVRLNGTSIINASSGPAVPTGRPVALVFTVYSGNRVDVAWDGKVQHTSTHSTATAAFTFSSIGNQTGEAIGSFALYAFAQQAFDAAELSANPWQIFEPRRILVPLAVAAGGFVFNPLSGRGGAAAQPLRFY